MTTHRIEVDIVIDCPGCGEEIDVEVPLLINSGQYRYNDHECKKCQQRFKIGGSMDYDIIEYI